MAADQVIRKLCAIFAADVVGYSRMIRNDEEGTLADMRRVRKEIVNPGISDHRGRIVKHMGDGLLAEFDSVVDAVQSAVELQQAVAADQINTPAEHQIRFRIGINLGDIVVDGDDIQGDGVNVAARLETLSEPGGICISTAVYDEVRNRLGLEFEDRGQQTLKNLDQPVHVWQWTPEPEMTSQQAATMPHDNERLSENDPPDARAALGDSEVMRRPAVLFLPFEAMGNSEENTVIASGLCEDIRTTLACWRWFPVIGPEALGNQSGDVQNLAESVGASYAMSGSVRRSGNRARVVARLIDAADGHELWSQSFDGNLEDVFEFQEDVSRRIVSQIEPEIKHAAAARMPISRPRDLTSWQLLASAAEEERKGGDGYGSKEANDAQRQLLLAAIEREPDLCEAWARLARCHFREFLLGWADDRHASLDACLEASARAVELDPGNSLARSYRAQCILFGNHDPIGALEHAQEAVRLNPSNVSGHIMMGCVLVYCGESDIANAHYEKALRLNPNFPNIGVILCDQMMCHALAGRMEEAVVLAHKVMTVAPKYIRGLQRCAAVLAHAGKSDEAREIIRNMEQTGSSFSETYLRETYPFVRAQDLEFLIGGLRQAGWKG